MDAYQVNLLEDLRNLSIVQLIIDITQRNTLDPGEQCLFVADWVLPRSIVGYNTWDRQGILREPRHDGNFIPRLDYEQVAARNAEDQLDVSTWVVAGR